MMVEIDLTSADLGRIANQGVDALRIANQNIWEAGSEPPVTYRIWPSTDGPLSYEDDASPYTMGMQFRVTADCALTAIYFWRAPNRPGSLGGGPTQSGDHFVTQCGLFDADTHTLVVPAETFDDPGAAVGWIRQQLDTPITLDTTHVYRVAVYGNWPGYSATRYYWPSTMRRISIFLDRVMAELRLNQSSCMIMMELLVVSVGKIHSIRALHQ